MTRPLALLALALLAAAPAFAAPRDVPTGPVVFTLEQNTPDPFCYLNQSGTTIAFALSRTAVVHLDIRTPDSSGIVRHLVQGDLEAGLHQVAWDGRDSLGAFVTNARYPYRLTALSAPPSADTLYDTTRVATVGCVAPLPITSFRLYQCDPNPFCPGTSYPVIRSEMPRPAYGDLRVLSPDRSSVVRVLFQGVLPAGVHQFVWDDRNDAGDLVGPGRYPYRLVFTNASAPFDTLYDGQLVAIASCDGIVGVGPDDSPETPRLALAGASPARGSVAFDITTPAGNGVVLRIFDVAGRAVRTLPLPESPRAHVAWDGHTEQGANAPAGLYLARLEAGGRTARCRFVLAR